MHRIPRHVAAAAAALLLAALGGCTTFRFPGGLPVGTPIGEARQSLGGPTAEYPRADGGTRLEFRQGAFGRQTFMLDFDPSGRLVSSQQVLTPQTFATITPGMTRDEVLRTIGHPAFAFPVGWQNLQVWNYRFGGLEGDCVVFQVSISNQTRTVTETGPNTDPVCDRDGSRD